jgi:hypothetical protein
MVLGIVVVAVLRLALRCVVPVIVRRPRLRSHIHLLLLPLTLRSSHRGMTVSMIVPRIAAAASVILAVFV